MSARRAGLEIAGVALVSALLASAVLRTCAPAHEDTRAQQLADNAYKSSRLALQRRRTADSLTRRALEIEHTVRNQARTIGRMGRAADSLLAANDARTGTPLPLAPDSAAQRASGCLEALRTTTAAFRTYRDSTDMLLASVDSLVTRHAAARAAFHAERLATDTLLAAKDAQIVHWQRRATCRLGPVRCPTRTQAAAFGFLAALFVP